MESRKEFNLPEEDVEYLDSLGIHWEAINDGSQWILLHDFPLPSGYSKSEVKVAIMISPGYPMTALDMAYFYPPVRRSDEKPIKATDATQTIRGEVFQRWSRHRAKGDPWKPGVDNLETHICMCQDWLEREFK
ncbi:MAG: hypothetical protein KDD35_03095 [Bdellovibrionales bacterium]|nr:hypothetical protein [Bdellovibrionales bacterium]